MTTVAEAQQHILAHARPFGTVTVPLAAAFGRVLAQPVVADRDYPPFNRATMDGYAVQSADFQHNAGVSLRLLERIHAGDTGTQIVETGTCSKIMTGAPVPSGADAVVRVEDTQLEGNQVRFAVATVRSGQNIAQRGEDARENDTLLTGNRLITPQAASVLAVTGHADVVVVQLPTVGIVSTGNEVVPLGTPVLPHQIRDSNAWALRGFFATHQITNVTAALAADDKAALRDTVAGLLEQKDVIVLSGGVSKGDADYVPEVLQSLGVRQVFHRVRIKPGGPLWFGVTAGGKAVFGLPGNPVSVQVACKVFIEPYLRVCFGLPPSESLRLPFWAERIKKTPFDEYFPVELVNRNGQTGVQAVRYNSSGDIAATVRSSGIALQPAATEKLLPGAVVAFLPW